jgi:hypothetical protein
MRGKGNVRGIGNGAGEGASVRAGEGARWTGEGRKGCKD